MIWWLWIVTGLALLLAEMLIPGTFFMLFLGISALGVGVLSALGALPFFWLQACVFAIFSGLLLTVIRAKIQLSVGKSNNTTDFLSPVGKIVVSKQHIDPHATGQVELQGTVWNAKNIGDKVIGTGASCVVKSIDGLLLMIEKETHEVAE